MIWNERTMKLHVSGKTVCQHRGEGLVAYVPEGSGLKRKRDRKRAA